MPSKPNALIIGAGIAGIAAAIRLAAKGHDVQVFEANAHPGGKLSQIDQQGYRFDAGPSLLTMPRYIDELFAFAGQDPRDTFNYQKLATICRYFYADGTMFDARAGENGLVESVADLGLGDSQNVQKHVNTSACIYDITHRVFLEQSLHRIKTWLSRGTFKSLLRIGKIDAFRTMHQANRAFFTSPKLVQYFDRYATYNGSNPYQAPATLNVIPHLEQHFGAYFPDGGMYSITTSLVKLAESLGVKFSYDSPVEDITLQGKKANGVKVKGDFIAADVVISNVDVWFTYQKLLSQHPKLHPKRILQQERSSSALIFYWGIKKQFVELDLHNIFFSADYEAEFNAIWKQKTISADPTVYLNISSKLKPDDAPPGCENWFVMINVPANTGQDWDALIAEARTNILNKLSRKLGTCIEQLIETETILDPRSIESKTSSYQGSIYGTSSNGQFAAFLRHANRSSKIKNLYFCGGSVHPGGGIPLCLLSAKIVSEWVRKFK